MCMSACIKAKIQNYIYGAPSESDMNPNITIFDIKDKANNELNIETGILQDECQLQIGLNGFYFALLLLEYIVFG